MANPARILIGLLVLQGLLLVAVAGTRVLGCDEIQHLQAAWQVALGRVPYRDFFEHHTPALYLLVAPLLAVLDVARDTGQALVALGLLRLGALALTLAMVVQTGLLARRLAGPEAGIWPGLVAALALAGQQILSGTAIEIRPDSAALVAVLGGVLILDRPGWRRGLVAGGLFALALMFTQKTLFLAPGILLALLIRRDWGLLGAVTGGFGLVAGLMLGGFALAGAAGDFIHYNFLLNAQWAWTASPWRLLPVFLEQDPEWLVLVPLALIAWARPRLRGGWAALVVPAVAASWLVGLMVIPVAQAQYWLMALPWVCAGAGAGVATLATGRGAWAMVAVALLVTIWSVWQRGATLARQDPSIQIARIDMVLTATPEDGGVVNGWCSPVLFRPNAFFHGFLHREVQALLTPADHRNMVAILMDPARAPVLISYDRAFTEPRWGGRLPPDFHAAVRAFYEPTGNGALWRRK